MDMDIVTDTVITEAAGTRVGAGIIRAEAEEEGIRAEEEIQGVVVVEVEVEGMVEAAAAVAVGVERGRLG